MTAEQKAALEESEKLAKELQEQDDAKEAVEQVAAEDNAEEEEP